MKNSTTSACFIRTLGFFLILYGAFAVIKAGFYYLEFGQITNLHHLIGIVAGALMLTGRGLYIGYGYVALLTLGRVDAVRLLGHSEDSAAPVLVLAEAWFTALYLPIVLFISLIMLTLKQRHKASKE